MNLKGQKGKRQKQTYPKATNQKGLQGPSRIEYKH